VYEEAQDKEFGVNFERVFKPNRGNKMVMAKKKKALKQPTKAVMVEAIVNLERGFEQLFNKIAVLDDVVKQYIGYKKDGEKFQAVLDVVFKERQEALENASAKAESAASGGSTPTSEE
jgi:hypothetical protein